MENLVEAINNFRENQLLQLAIPASITAFVVIGLGFILGWRKIVDWCKEHILFVLLGLILIFLAPQIIVSFTDTLQF